MIFSLWYIAWLLAASSMTAFLVPYLALMVRGSYMSNRLSFVRPAHLIIALFMFFGLLWGSLEPRNAFLLTAQILGFMALFYHLYDRFENVNLHVLPEAVAAAGFIGTRYYRLVSQKRQDFEFAVRMRVYGEEGSPLSRLICRVKLTFYGVVSALVDFVVLVQQIVTVLQSRGGLPHPKYWSSTSSRSRSAWVFPVVDAVYVGVLTVAILGSSEQLMPQEIELFLRNVVEAGVETIRSSLPHSEGQKAAGLGWDLFKRVLFESGSRPMVY